MSGQVIIADDSAVGAYAAAIIFDDLVATANNNRGFVLGCPGGRTPRSTYIALAALIAKSRQDISHVTIAMMDEFLSDEIDGTFSNHSIEKHFSCARFAIAEIFSVLNAGAPKGGEIKIENVRYPDAKNPAAYEEFLQTTGVNVFLMASGGSDGHVAFNPPGTALSDRTRIVKIAETTRRDNLGTFPDFKSINEVPRYGVTVGPATMVEVSEKVIMELIGSHKREAFNRISTAISYESDWASTVVHECKEYFILADEAAAGR